MNQNVAGGLWQSIMSEYEIGDSGGLAMLAQACAAVDRIVQFGEAIDRDGPVIRTKQGPKDHPLLKHGDSAPRRDDRLRQWPPHCATSPYRCQ